MAPDLLSTIRREIDERLSELRPLLAEYERLLSAVEALEVAGDQGDAASVPKSAAPKPAAPAESASAAPKPAAPAKPVTAKPVTAKPARAKPVRGRARPVATRRGSAAGAIELAATGPVEAAIEGGNGKRPTVKDKPERAARGVVREAILAALDHGSHTVSELAMVTAMSGPNINGNLRKLVAEGAIVKTEREGKAAWALPDAIG
ncbi:MAG TPA: helix-turn-helix domain-containing protein [Solirubrobacteraceae bacterium]